MKLGALILGIIVSIALLAAAGFLYTMAGDRGERHYRTSIDVIRQIQELSSNWSIEIARVRTDPLADFDTLTAFAPQMNRLRASLSDTSREIPDLPDRIANDIHIFQSAIAAKEERIERFKTTYAVVRNSTRYLPLAAANVTRQAQDADNDALESSISILTQDMNLYLASPTGAVKGRLNAEVEKLREASVAYPLPLANALANLLAHAEVLLSRQVPMNDLFQKATSNEISEFSNRLVDSLEFEFRKASTLASYYERGVVAVVGVLALFWIVLVLQHRARRRSVPARRVDRASAGVAADSPSDPAYDEQLEPLHSAEMRDELGTVAPFGAFARELSTAGPAQPSPEPAGLSAESAMLYGFLAERVGDSLVATAEKVSSRMDYLRQAQHKIHHALHGSEFLPDLPDGGDLDEELEASSTIAAHAHREINGIADLAKRLASFSSLPNGDAERDMVNVNACIDEVVAATGADRAAAVSKRFGTVPEIFASRTEIRLMLAQILENSMHAVDGLDDRQGTIKIDTASHGENVQITIIDNGAGIAPDNRAKIFKPFYTSRDGAMGLGLTLTGHLVKKYEGSIKVNSLPGQGTVTRITLPTGTPGP